MKRLCKLLINNETVCGLKICCADCDDKCTERCGDDPESCGNVMAHTELKNDKFLQENIDTMKKISEFIIEKQKLEDQEKILKEKLEKSMMAYNVKKFTNDYLTLTYIEPTTIKSIDTKKLKEELPLISEKYSKVTNKKGYVKIEVRNVAREKIRE